MTPSNRQSTDRRRFLAGLTAVSGVAVAGCSSLPWIDDETSGSFPVSEVASVLSPPAPRIDGPVPVQPDASAIETALERVDELVAPIPDPLTAEAVPNGVVRESITDARDEAGESRAEAADATGPALYHALRDLRGGRASARQAMTTWAAIDDETLTADLEDEYSDLQPRVRDQHTSLAYRGNATDDELLRSALYYSRLEAALNRAVESLRRWGLDGSATVIDTGEAAADLESAAATASGWEHLADRYEATLEEPVDLESILRGALERCVDHADGVAFPAQDDDWFDEIGVGDIDETYLEHILWRTGGAVTDERERMETAVSDGDLGTGLYHAVRFEQAFRAFEVVRDRIADGSVSLPETLADVRDERETAIGAAETARDELTDPSPGALALAETGQRLEWTDQSVRRVADTDSDAVTSLNSEYGDYVRVRASLEVLPEAVDAFRSRVLEG
ncbi:hypothetical protein [Natrinema longum]|uniref:Tat (Twin-arginine translocation) pathway signal sequence n=1 Tax=Natrinema longum TaxID=370324 RepID=A0A8A2U991_9EURY|nr:hypothetical protein [Natrinema longum]MBZ6496737.1 hypothetical protein [Natrinema longum]QSW85371.1 hypothetical protein J0X27_00525 [Natrinema longum]